jgi:small subunit ribosomal protein S11
MAKQKQKKIRKGVVRGIAHVKATHNNTIITVTDTSGETLAWDSAGTIGFKGARKSTPFAATRAGEQVGQKVRKMGMSEVEVKVTGTGAGRESAVQGLVSTGIRVTAVEDHTAVPHNGCRPRKKRRV